MAMKPGGGEGKPSSFTHLLESDTQRRSWDEFDRWLRRELIVREPEWSAAVWEDFQQAADARFPAALKGALLRAKRIQRRQPVLLSRMLRDDTIGQICASVYVARQAGALNIAEPLAVSALVAAADDRTNHPGDIAVLRYVLSLGADPDIRWEGGQAALHTATLRGYQPVGHPRAVKALLDAGADPDIRTDSGCTPLLLLCDFDSIDDTVAEAIRALRARGARIDAADQDGHTPVAQLRTGAPKEHPESDESRKNRRELLGEFEQDDLNDLLPMGAPSVKIDINGERR